MPGYRFFHSSLAKNALLPILLLAATVSYGQKKVKLQQADVARRGGRGPERFERLLGNVVFKQNNTTIYCDSAHFYKKRNSLNAFGKVRITEGDSVTITGRKLEYDGDGKVAKLRSNVVLTKLATATLYTDFLDYRRAADVADYFNGGKLVDSTNTLTSTRGYYNLKTNIVSFKQKVKVVNPDYTMYADSLQYNSKTKVINFVAKTTVVNKDSSTLEYEKGTYNTISKRSILKEGVVESEEYTVKGNKYDVDAIHNITKIRGDVVMTHKKENLIIYGQASDNFKELGITKIYDRAYVAKVTDNGDTLFMRADTLVSIDSKDAAKKKVLAYHNVKIFKSDLQGLADSVEYRQSDSLLFFYNKPILWSQGNQLTADSISMLIKHNTLSKIFLKANAFVISTDTLLNFNQIKGRKMTADITNSKISRVLVEGNGESLYYALDEKNQYLMGMNKIICSNIIIRFKEGKVFNLSFLVQPEANFFPPHEIQNEEKTLKGFAWKADQKPSKNDVVKAGSGVIQKPVMESSKLPKINGLQKDPR
jgi:lipopolysaccharide export system protein LptA